MHNTLAASTVGTISSLLRKPLALCLITGNTSAPVTVVEIGLTGWSTLWSWQRNRYHKLVIVMARAYTVKQAAEELGISATAVRSLVAAGKLQGFRPVSPTGKIVIDGNVLSDYKQACQELQRSPVPWQSQKLASIGTSGLKCSLSERLNVARKAQSKLMQ